MAKISATKAEHATDSSLEENGAWMILAGGGRFRVRSQHSKPAREYARKQVKRNRHIYANGGTPSIDQQDEMDIDFCVDALVTGLDTFEDDNGQAIPYSRDLVRELVSVARIRKQVLEFANDATNYGIEGNSLPSSKQS